MLRVTELESQLLNDDFRMQADDLEKLIDSKLSWWWIPGKESMPVNVSVNVSGETPPHVFYELKRRYEASPREWIFTWVPKHDRLDSWIEVTLTAIR